MVSASAVGMTPRPATSSSIQYPIVALCSTPRITLLTLHWPTTRPPYTTMNGSAAPVAAERRRLRISRRPLAGELRWYQGSGEVGSHGSSQRRFRILAWLHARASLRRGPRNSTAPASSVAGQPG